MHTVKDLLDKALEKCHGSQSELAREIGVYPQDIHDLIRGSRPITGEMAGMLASVLDISGEEAQRLAIMAMIENPKNAKKREVLKRAFFGYSVGGTSPSEGTGARLKIAINPTSVRDLR